jgi:hypothetical protein
MRRSELAGVDVALIDLTAGRLTVEDTRIVVDGKAAESDGKTASGRRTIALDPLTVSYLRRHLAMLAEERREFGEMYQDHGKLFCHPDGRPIHPTPSPGGSTAWSTGPVCRRSGCMTCATHTPRCRLTQG